MTLDGLLLPLGVACLGVPMAVVCGRRMRETLDRPVRRQNGGLLSLIQSPLNWVDLGRAAGGTWLVQRALQGAIDSGDELAMTFLGVELAIFLVGILAQTLWLRKPIRVIGPIFYLTGLTLVMSGMAGAFALAAAFACALMFRRVSLVFILAPIGLLGFGYLFRDLSIPIAFNAAVFGLPPLLSFRFATRMSFLRKSAGPQAYVAPPAATSHSALRVEEPLPSAAAPSAEPASGSMAVAEPPRPEEVAPVIRPNFARPDQEQSSPGPVAPSAGEGTVAEPAPSRPTALPDFLRLADDEEPVQRKTKKSLFARKRA